MELMGAEGTFSGKLFLLFLVSREAFACSFQYWYNCWILVSPTMEFLFHSKK